MGVSSFFLLTGPFSCETPSDPLDQFDVQNCSTSWLVGSRAAFIEQIAVVTGVIRFLFDFISDLLLAHPPGILCSQKMQELYPLNPIEWILQRVISQTVFLTCKHTNGLHSCRLC